MEPTPEFYKDEFADTKEKGRSFGTLFQYLIPYKRLVFQLFLGVVLGSLLQLVLPFLTQSVVDIGINTQNLTFLYIILIAQLALFAGRLMVDFIRSWILYHISSRVAFTGFVEEGQQLKVNETICYVNPGNSSYYAEAIVPQSNFGKITDGQMVLLRFAAYPSAEFGMVKGEIAFISRITSDSGYMAKVLLAQGLTTNYSKVIQYRDGLKASGEIVTRNVSLLQRFYYSIAGHINN